MFSLAEILRGGSLLLMFSHTNYFSFQFLDK